jgi:hypothetical protein
MTGFKARYKNLLSKSKSLDYIMVNSSFTELKTQRLANQQTIQMLHMNCLYSQCVNLLPGKNGVGCT